MVLAPAHVDIPALKARHPLGDVVEESGIRLRGRGRVRQGVCPFHEEGEGSFTVYGDSERFYCFGCGAGGDVLDFVQKVEGIGLPEAIRHLGGDIGDRARSLTRRVPSPPKWNSPTLRNPALLTEAARFYARELRQGSEGPGYLASRGIGLDAASRLGVGFAPGRGLRRHLEAAGFCEKTIRDSGLFLGHGIERFADMVVLPYVVGGTVHWLGGRAIDPGVMPRFQAPPGPKPVLGLGRLGRPPKWVVLTEGLMDWLTLAHWGLPACAALGTKGLERVAGALMGCPRVFLAFDSDDAGLEAAACLMGLLGSRAVCVNLPRGVSDVAEIASLALGKDLFMRLLKRAALAAR